MTLARCPLTGSASLTPATQPTALVQLAAVWWMQHLLLNDEA